MKLSGKLGFAFCYEGRYKNQRCSSTISVSIDCAHPDMHRRSGIAAVPEASVGWSLHNPSMVNAVGGVTFRGGRTGTLCGFSAAPLPGAAFPTLLQQLLKKPLQALSECHAEHHETNESYRRSVNVDVDEHVAKIRDLWHNALA